MEIGELEIALFLYGGNMENIKRPKQVSRAEKQVLSDKNAQQNTQEQFETIYDYLDALKDMIDIPEEPEEEPEEPQAEPFSYKDLVVSQHALSVSGLTSGNAKNFNTTVTKEGYYPLSIASTTCVNHSTAGFTINPIRISTREEGQAVVYSWARNDASAKNACTGYIDILWVKIK